MSNKYTNWYLSDENRMKAQLSATETEDMVDRALKCPHCGHVAGIIYEDCKGHYKTKCIKCRQIFTVNFDYFRRMHTWFLYPKFPLVVFSEEDEIEYWP